MINKNFHKIKSKILKSEFNQNVLTLITGTTLAQALPVVISPIITRLYTPEDFGILSIFLAITSIFSTIVHGRYSFAILLPKKDEDAINVFALGFIITLVISFILLIIIIVFKDHFVNFFDNKDFVLWFFLIPASVFLIGFWDLLKFFNIRKKKYKDVAKSTILKSVVLSIALIGIGMIKSISFGLIVSRLLSEFSANLKLLSNIFKNKALIKKISIIRIIFLAKKFKDLPIYNAPAALSDVVASMLPSLLLPKLFGLTMAGYFFMAYAIITIPSGIIGTSISAIFFKEMSDLKNKRLKCWPFFVKTFKKLIFIGLPISIFFFISAPFLFEIIFGENWKVSGKIGSYLGIVFLFSFVISTVSNVFIISGYVRRGAYWKHLYLITSVSIFTISFLIELKFFEFLNLFVIHQIVLYSFYLYLIVRTVRQMDNRI